MKQTNYQLFDFLDFDPDLENKGNNTRLWKACPPTDIMEIGNAVVLSIPFQCQQLSNEITPDKRISKNVCQLKIQDYGDRILRISLGIGKEITEDSPLLDLHPEIKTSGLKVEKTAQKWVIRDQKDRVRAVFHLAEHSLDHWSDLLPAPEESLEATFFPDGNRAVKIHAYDQFYPARMEAMALAYVEEDGIPDRATISFQARPDEKFVGTGERFSKMDLSGKTVQLKNQDGQGVNNRRTYKNVPFYMSSEMYGLFLHTNAYAKISLADHSTRSVQLLVEEPLIDIFLIGGEDPGDILHQYRKLTGFPGLPPLWSFGVWMSRMTYFSETEVNQICNRLREEDYPCDVIHLDTGWFRTDWLCEWKFNPERFPDPKGFIAGLKDRGFRVSLWQMPYIAGEAEQYPEAKTNNYIGSISKNKMRASSNFSALDYAGTIDFTNPGAVDWYKGLLKELLEMGVVCIKTDFGEEIHMDADYFGMEPKYLNNLYALLYQKAAYEVTREVTGEGIIWARAGWAGSQRYPLHWGGDAAATWDGMAGSLKGGLHLGLSGFGFWSHDVPGFHGLPDFMNSVIPDDLYMRWTQFGVFTSHIRYHGTSKREPYHYPNIAAMVRKWWKLRYALIPYILEQSKNSVQGGFPVLRALIFHHPKDKMCWHIDDQYYFGSDFLVAPVMNSENRREIYLPEGNWVDFFNGKVTEGGRWLTCKDILMENMPVWVKLGAVIPLYLESVSCTDEMDLRKTRHIRIDASFSGIWEVLEKQYIKTGR